MSHHEWNDVMYGIELPNAFMNEEKLFEFVEEHKNVFSQFVSHGDLPTTPDDVWDFVDEYEDDMGESGIGVLINDVIGCRFIHTTHDQYGNTYIGMYAVTMFPWQHNMMGDEWESITPEYIEGKIRPVVEELYGTCPNFGEHTIWING